MSSSFEKKNNSINTRKSTVLIVDDINDNLDVLAEILGGTYRVKAANNGIRALKIAQTLPPPDMILLDVMMPDMDGLEVCQRLKSDDLTKDIPIIFVSAKGDARDETKGFEMGAVDYITKPVSPPVVLARVKNHLELKESREQNEALLEKMGRYVSPHVTKAIQQGSRDACLETYRRKLTVFFSDIVGFTTLTENLSPEDLTFILNNYFTEMERIVVKHGGTLDKFIGDAIMVFFGDPESKGITEDALACIRMAQEMQLSMYKLAEESIKRGIRRPLAIRMGVSSGYCNVGNFGSKNHMDYTIIGRHTNLAARVQTAAEPGQILISKETWYLINEQIRCIRKEPVLVKGFSEPIDVFEVLELPGGKTIMEKMSVSQPGFKLDFDLDVISNDSKESVLLSLNKALHMLEQDYNE